MALIQSSQKCVLARLTLFAAIIHGTVLYVTHCGIEWVSVCARKRDGEQFVRTILWSRVAHVTSAQHWSICTYRDRTNFFIYLSIYPASQPSIHPSTFYPRRDQMRQREWITVSVAIHLLDDLEAKYQQYLISTAHFYLLVQVWIDNLPIDKFEFDESACVFIYIYKYCEDRHIVYEIVANSIVICCFLPN